MALCAKIHVKKLKKSSMDGNAQAEPCTRKLAWFRLATSMDGRAQVHGWTFRSAWFRFRRCMDGLENRNRRDRMSRLIDHLALRLNRRLQLLFQHHPALTNAPAQGLSPPDSRTARVCPRQIPLHCHTPQSRRACPRQFGNFHGWTRASAMPPRGSPHTFRSML